jgi:phage terminase large subunit-like protein
MDAIRYGPTGFPPENRTLIWSILQWQLEYLLQPDGPDAGQPWRYTPEQLRFLAWFYAIDERGKFAYRRAVYRRVKGSGKDPMVATVCATEFIGLCRFGGFDAAGMPVAVPHPAPWISIAAVSFDQNRNTMSLFPTLFSKSAHDDYGIDLGKQIIYSGAGGRIEAVTSSPRTLEGGRPSLVAAAETQHWLANNDGLAMWEVIARNLAKSRDGAARALAHTNAHDPGEQSVAAQDWEAFQAIADGRSAAAGLLYDSLEPDADIDLSSPEELREALIVARGDSTWLDVDRLMGEILDPATPPSMSRRFYLNQLTSTEDAWLAPHEWAACSKPTEVLADKDVVTLGFDGGLTDDSTCLVAVRVSDAHTVLLGAWEKPLTPGQHDWHVDRASVDAAVRNAMERYQVVGFFCDPALWESYVDTWSQDWGARMKVKASHGRPLEFRMNRPTVVVNALERFRQAVLAKAMSHDGSSVLARHCLNARRRMGRSGMVIAKDHPGSPNKIDGAYAATLAFEARSEAVAAGIELAPRRSKRIVRF